MAYRGLPRGAAAAAARRDSGRRDREREARGEATGARVRERVKGPRCEQKEFIVREVSVCV